jgi:hypothetical protein
VGGKEAGGGGKFGSTGAVETTAPEVGASGDWREGTGLLGACWVGVNTTSWSTVTSSDVGEDASKPGELCTIIDDSEAGTGASVEPPSLAGNSVVVLLELGAIAVEPG